MLCISDTIQATRLSLEKNMHCFDSKDSKSVGLIIVVDFYK